MNTRIQVEHPVTEAITGIDLVETQIRVAAGETLSFRQEDVRFSGHAIEVRIYAEDPDKGFVPSPGTIAYWSAPSGPGVRLDSGFEGGDTITPYYDPMIAKLIVHGGNREEALSRLADALEAFTIAGIRTSLPFLRRLLVNPVFRSGVYDTDFVEAEMSGGPDPISPELHKIVLSAVAVLSARSQVDGSVGETDAGPPQSFMVSFPKEEAIRATVHSARNPCRVELGAANLEFEIRFDPETTVGANLIFEKSEARVEFVPRKKGGFDVGLRDRALCVKSVPI